MTEILSAVGCSLVIIILARVLSKIFTTKLFAAAILVAIAFIYVGFSLKDNPISLIVLEIAVASVFFFTALIGYKSNPALIAYGIIGHGVWDFLHHRLAVIPTAIPTYWPVFCAVVDLITGIYFLMIFRREKKLDLE
ncbi:MAG TPA: DUF6010 family protein [Flavitalea sp.]|nr:DUF6010 family protein [Flavitalea sp.]